MAIRLKYQTGIVTLIQFLIGTVLSFINEVISIVSGCSKAGSDCLGNAIGSLSLVIITALWFAFVAAIGYAAQDRRSRRLAVLLIFGELAIAGGALLDLRHAPNPLSFLTSAVDFVLAAWAIVLAFRLSRARGGRIVSHASSRTRQRRHSL